MNWKILSILVVLTGGAVYGVWHMQQQQQFEQTDTPASALLYPQLAQQANAINKVQIIGAGEQALIKLNLADDNKGWVVSNYANYPVNVSTLRALLTQLAQTKILETKTSKPERYSALAVEAIDQPTAQGVLLALAGAEDINLIVGKPTSGGGSNTYVRKADEAQSLLVSGNITVEQTISQWAKQPILDIAGEQIQRVVIKHDDGEQLTVHKPGLADPHFTLFNLLAGRELSHETVANPIGGALADLRLENVSLASAKDKSQPTSTTVDFYAFDGRKISVALSEQNGKTYAQFSMAFDAEQYKRFQQAPTDETESADDATNAEETDDTEATAPDTETAERQAEKLAKDVQALTQQADAINAQLRPWLYEISRYKYDLMSKRLEDLLKPKEEAEATAESAASVVVPDGIPSMPQINLDSATNVDQ